MAGFWVVGKESEGVGPAAQLVTICYSLFTDTTEFQGEMNGKSLNKSVPCDQCMTPVLEKVEDRFFLYSCKTSFTVVTTEEKSEQDEV